MTGRLHFHFSLSCIREGNGKPLQYSCLENPRDGRAWWAAVYGVAQSRTRLRRLSSSSSVLILLEPSPDLFPIPSLLSVGGSKELFVIILARTGKTCFHSVQIFIVFFFFHRDRVRKGG